MERLNELGTTFYLERSPKELAHRLKNAKDQRPLLVGLSEDDLIDFIVQRLGEREETYRQANFVLSRDEQNTEKILEFIRLLQ